jgi:hypothetical protein
VRNSRCYSNGRESRCVKPHRGLPAVSLTSLLAACAALLSPASAHAQATYRKEFYANGVAANAPILAGAVVQTWRSR